MLESLVRVQVRPPAQVQVQVQVQVPASALVSAVPAHPRYFFPSQTPAHLLQHQQELRCASDSWCDDGGSHHQVYFLMCPARHPCRHWRWWKRFLHCVFGRVSSSHHRWTCAGGCRRRRRCLAAYQRLWCWMGNGLDCAPPPRTP